MATRGYNSYHGRSSLWKILIAVVLLLLLLAAGGFLLLQDYIVYNSDGSIRLELPLPHLNHGDAEEDPKQPERLPPPAEPGEPENPEGAGQPGEDAMDLPPVVILPQDEPPAEPLRANILTAAALCDTDAEPLNKAKAAGQNGFFVTLKGDDGVFYYAWEQALAGAASSDAVSRSQLKTALSGDEDLQAAAVLSCFHDSAYAFSDMAGTGICQPNGYIWYDYSNSHWLDPSKQAARDYLCALAKDCIDMGFDELLLTECHYPVRGKLHKIDYSKMAVTKEEGLALFLKQLRETVGEEVVLDIQVDLEFLLAGRNTDAGIDIKALLPLVDHICVDAGDREAEALEAVRAAGAEEPEKVLLWRRGETIVSAEAE